MANKNDLLLQLSTRYDGKGLKKGRNDLGQFTAGAKKQASGLSKAFAGLGLAIGGAFALRALKDVINTFADFEQQVKNVAVIMGGDVASNFDAVAKKAKQVGAATKFSASEAAGAMMSLGQAGLSVADVLGSVQAATDLAAATQADMGQATGIMATTMKVFSMEASEAGHISDVFAEALRSSMLSMESLTEAMKVAGPAGRSLGNSLETTTAVVAQFRDLGLEGSSAGMAFKMGLQSITKATDTTRAALERIGLTFEQVNPLQHDAISIMETLAATNMDAADAINIFGARSGTGWATIIDKMREGENAAGDLREKLIGADGVAGDMATEQIDTLKGSMTLLGSATEGLAVSFGENLSPAVREVVDLLRQTAGWANQLINGFPKDFLTDALAGDITALEESRRHSMAVLKLMEGRADVAPRIRQGLLEEMGILEDIVGTMDEYKELTGQTHGRYKEMAEALSMIRDELGFTVELSEDEAKASDKKAKAAEKENKALAKSVALAEARYRVALEKIKAQQVLMAGEEFLANAEQSRVEHEQYVAEWLGEQADQMERQVKAAQARANAETKRQAAADAYFSGPTNQQDFSGGASGFAQYENNNESNAKGGADVAGITTALTEAIASADWGIVAETTAGILADAFEEVPEWLGTAVSAGLAFFDALKEQGGATFGKMLIDSAGEFVGELLATLGGELPAFIVALLEGIFSFDWLGAIWEAIKGVPKRFMDNFREIGSRGEQRRADRRARRAGGFAIGTTEVPATGIYQLHAGEAVIPADSNPYRGMGNQPFDEAVGSGGGGGVNITVNMPVNAIDARDMRDRMPEIVRELRRELARQGGI